MELIQLGGRELTPYVDTLARLRITVFREYPYLYDGDLAYEAGYLQTYMRSAGAIAVLALDKGQPVGMSTGVPMADEELAFRQPFLERGIDTAQLFYCGESVLLPAYRGHGVYRRFFEARESHARAQGFKQIGFCGVLRAANDPRRPPDYQPLDPVWRHFGYRPEPGLLATFPWREIGATGESEHSMQFWLKALE